MIRLQGTSVSSLSAIGHIKKYNGMQSAPEMVAIEDIDQEIAKFEEAVNTANEQLQALYDKTLSEQGEEFAAIIEVQQMMLEDDDLLDGIRDCISDESVCAAWASYTVGRNFSEFFASMDNDYMKAKATDVLEATGRLARILTGQEEEDLASSGEKVILVADDLGPGETVRLDRDSILAFVTVRGSVNSHTAILARTMNIPALVAVDMDMDSLTDGALAIVDGKTGEFTIEPDDAVLAEMQEVIKAQEAKMELLKSLKGQATETKSGKRIKLYANIGSVQDVDSVISEDGEGIGLFRSEFLFLGRDSAPSEEEQFEAYRAVLKKMGDKPVIVRTLDIGADKKVDYLGLAEEENPAMGLRAIRICLTNHEIFKAQLRALLRAACFGNLHIMYPMIISESEIDEIKSIVDTVAKELEEENIAYKIPSQGIMIETPASVIISEELAKKVDFFSIGTNDLTQYTLAIDRQSQSLDRFYDSHHPAVLKMIKMVVDNSHNAGIWTGICGELGADESLTQTFVDMGVDELSVSPGAILGIRNIVRNMD